MTTRNAKWIRRLKRAVAAQEALTVTARGAASAVVDLAEVLEHGRPTGAGTNN